MRRIALACGGNGFGPVAKLTAIANLLPDLERIFIGDDGAYAFAQRNRKSYERILTIDEFWKAPHVARSSDFAIVVMEPDMVFGFWQMGLPVFLFDSLLESWAMPHGLAPLAAAFRQIRRATPTEARAIFKSFAHHERMILAHMLATRSFAQNFPGVPERVAELRRFGVERIQLLGSIIDARTRRGEEAHAARGGTWTLLINLGGVRCSGIEFYKNDYIIDLMEQWAERYLQTDKNCREIFLCCGRYGSPKTHGVGFGMLTRQFTEHDAFIRTMTHADVVLTAAGRTTLHEAIHLGKLPILLPEQNFNQYCNIKALRIAVGGSLSVSLKDIVGLDELPYEDMRGTEFIAQQLHRILSSEELFDRFYNALRGKIKEIRSLDETKKRELGDTIGRYFSGLDFATAVRDLAALQDAGRHG